MGRVTRKDLDNEIDGLNARSEAMYIIREASAGTKLTVRTERGGESDITERGTKKEIYGVLLSLNNYLDTEDRMKRKGIHKGVKVL